MTTRRSFTGRLRFPTRWLARAEAGGSCQALADGVGIANPHVFAILDGGGHSHLPGNAPGFRHEADPLGLLNPGRMRDYRRADPSVGDIA